VLVPYTLQWNPDRAQTPAVARFVIRRSRSTRQPDGAGSLAIYATPRRGSWPGGGMRLRRANSCNQWDN